MLAQKVPNVDPSKYYEVYGHRTVTINLGGELTEIDEGVAEAVRMLNSLKGVQTRASCHGDAREDTKAYVAFFAQTRELGAKVVGSLIHALSILEVPFWVEREPACSCPEDHGFCTGVFVIRVLREHCEYLEEAVGAVARSQPKPKGR